jgi:4-hydroxy-3-methylbut-2-enyl diphosphate reductase
MPAYFVQDESEILSDSLIRHYDYSGQELKQTSLWLPKKNPLHIVLTSGASCPDTVLEAVMNKILDMTGQDRSADEVIAGM